LSFIKHFRPEFEYYIQHGRSMVEDGVVAAREHETVEA
jgi:NADH-quinone oxidoreductase subunit F